jgi:glutathione synthetase
MLRKGSHLFKLPAYPSNPHLVPTAFPENSTAGTLAAGLASAHAAYGDSKTQPSRPLCMLIIVQSNEHNIFDQYALTSILQSDYSVPTFRLPFSSTLALTEISSSDPSRVLLYKPPHCSSNLFEVSVLYFRAAYTPSDYPTDTAWSARLHLERSAAIKCPSILTHLAGSKKIQQVLAIPGSPHLSRFLEPANVSPENIERVRATFAAIYPLDDSDVGRTARSLALDDTDAKKFVLKPQREGGGNNIYRSAIPKFLRGTDQGKWKSYVLMEMIEAPRGLGNAILRNGKVEKGQVIGELGVYGSVIWRSGLVAGADEDNIAGGKWILENKEAGYLLRTKRVESEEGGVAAGFGAVDSCLLV